VGAYHSCGLTEGNRIFCWGANESGQLGNGTNSSEKVPVEVKTEERFTKLAAGGAHTCAISSDGVMYCWGRNAQGQLGDGTTTPQTTPVPVRMRN
jgi:alpha-tubulin suppressor-like RCC1 family protein